VSAEAKSDMIAMTNFFYMYEDFTGGHFLCPARGHVTHEAVTCRLCRMLHKVVLTVLLM
jgi:hypothetical protein